MPHVRATEYPRVNSSFELAYVEIIHRHHKRTPYAANTFPAESYPWYCSDEGLFYSGAPIPTVGANHSASTYWDVYTSPSNPLAPTGFNGTCQFPQITRGGLDDSHQHGVDIFSVYHDLLHFIPASYDPKVISYRVTNNVITSEVVSMLIAAMYPSTVDNNIPLLIQPDSIDSLEPAYSCPASTSLFSSFASGSTTGSWQTHLTVSATLFSSLDAISGVSPSTSGWHVSWDHYYDNLSSRLCHFKPLPCNISHPSQCITNKQAEEVFRLGQWEYSYTYRDNPLSLPASVAGYGIYVAELAQNLRDAMSANATDAERVKYRHNVAHDGSVSRLLSILQIESMVWPGMGAEVVFELYKAAIDKDPSSGATGKWFLRVLWGGRVLRSSVPEFGVMDMVGITTVLSYLDGLVGVGAQKVPSLCAA